MDILDDTGRRPGLLARIRHRLDARARRRTRRRDHAALDALSDYYLRDVGLYRDGRARLSRHIVQI